MAFRIPPATAVDPQLVLPPISSPSGLWKKLLIWVVSTTAQGILLSQFDEGTSMEAAGAGADGTEAGTWRRFQHVWSNLVSADTADDVVYTIDIVNLSNGAVDPTWTSADYSTVFPQLETIASTLSNYCASHLQLTEIRSYMMAFNPYTVTKPFALSGAPEAVHTAAVTGKLAQPAGAQICTTVTEITPVRAHWGRFFSPSLGANALTGGGRLASTAVDAIATGVQGNYQALMTQEFQPVVPVTQQAVNEIKQPDGSVLTISEPLRALQTLIGVQVDDVPDVQRRRRPKTVQHRMRLPVVALELDAQPEQQPAA